MTSYLLRLALVTAISSPALALADSGQNEAGSSLAVIIFLFFIGVIIVGQLIPGIMLFWSMLKGMFRRQHTDIKSTNPK